MKKLFAVKESKGRLVPDRFFDNKRNAKLLRDALNADAIKGVQYTVTLGPEHNRY